jgi:hypothetical protein
MPRLHIRIKYPIKEPDKFELKTDIKKEKVPEILSSWLSMQMGRGKDEREAIDRDVYNIKIDLELEDDTFYSDSDTGNKGLTVGIVMDVLKRLDKDG